MEVRKVSSINADQYIGQDVKVISAKFEDMKNPVIRLISEVIELKGDDKLPEGKVLTASKIIGLKHDPSDDSVVLAEQGKGVEFLKAKKVDLSKIPDYENGKEIECLIGLQCKVQKNEKGYLDLI